MTERTIENLEEVLSGIIDKSKKIHTAKITNLTNPGENYGSIMSKLDITLRNEEDGSSEEIYAVAKQIPEQEFTRKLFNIQVTFKNEIAMYDTIIPTLQNFQKENGVSEVVDCFPECYGARINLDGASDTVDENGVLILENLISKGFEVVDRHVGFNLNTAKLILKNLAAFHALPIALKLRNPEAFKNKIKPYLAPFRIPSMPYDDEHFAMLLELLEESIECSPWMPKVKTIFKNRKEITAAPPKEPFATMTHGDMWVNNTMVKFENGAPVDNKLLDFQVCDYKSAATDVFFFLFTSVQLSILEENLDSLIKFYHEHFVSHLDQSKCDTSPFSFSKFLEEIKAATLAEMSHTIVMLTYIVFAKKGGPSTEFDEKAKPDFTKMKKDIPHFAREKCWFLIKACGKRGWL